MGRPQHSFRQTTYGPVAPLEDAGALDDDANRRLLLAVVDEITRHSVEGKVVLVDTLHVTQRVRPGVLGEASFGEIDQALAKLGTHVLFVRAERQTILARAVEGRRGSGFRAYASKFAADEDGLASYFLDEQARMLAEVGRLSRLPWSVLPAEDPPEALVADALAIVDGVGRGRG